MYLITAKVIATLLLTISFAAAQDCTTQTTDLFSDPNVAAALDDAQESQSAQFAQCPATSTCLIDDSALVPSFQATCLEAGGQFFTFDYDIECDTFGTDLAQYTSMPLCVGVLCNTAAVAQSYVDLQTESLQGSDNEVLRTCTAVLRGTTPGVTGPPTQSPSPQPLVSPPTVPPTPSPSTSISPPTAPLPTLPSSEDCSSQTSDLFDDSNVAAALDDVQQVESSQLDQCSGASTCFIDDSELVPSFQATCLEAGGQFFTFDYDVQCAELAVDFLQYTSVPFCVGVLCNTDSVAQNLVDFQTETLQGSDNEFLQTCAAVLRGTTPGVTGPATQPSSTQPPVSPPTLSSTLAPSPTVVTTNSPVVPNCEEHTTALLNLPALATNPPDFDADQDCVAQSSTLLSCTFDAGEVNPDYETDCISAGGQYVDVDTSFSCVSLARQNVNVLINLQDFPICFGAVCDVDALDDDYERALMQSYMEGLEATGSFDCSGASVAPPNPAPVALPSPTVSSLRPPTKPPVDGTLPTRPPVDSTTTNESPTSSATHDVMGITALITIAGSVAVSIM